MLCRESGLRVATPPEWGIFKWPLRTLYSMHQDPKKFYFLESLIHPLKVLLKVPGSILILNRIKRPQSGMYLFKFDPLCVSLGKLLKESLKMHFVWITGAWSKSRVYDLNRGWLSTSRVLDLFHGCHSWFAETHHIVEPFSPIRNGFGVWNHLENFERTDQSFQKSKLLEFLMHFRQRSTGGFKIPHSAVVATLNPDSLGVN